MKRLSYENWKLNKITKEEFLSSSNDYENKIEKCKSDIYNLYIIEKRL